MKEKQIELFKWKRKELRNYRVYMHVFPNGMRYVGMSRISLAKRWENGFSYRKKPEMFKDIEKYGWKNIKHIIYDNDGQLYTKEEAGKKESQLIALWQTNDENKGYNKESGGLCKYTVHPDTISKFKRAKHKVVLQYTLDGEFINEFVSVKDASRITGILHASIASAARGDRERAGGFIWKYKVNL